jgi:hypothetical protein
MTKFYLALILLSLLFSACHFSPTSQIPPPAPPKIEWKEFISDEGRFKVLFPGIPHQTFKENDTPNGKVKTTIFDVALTEDYFEVRYGDFLAEPDVNQNDLKSYYDFIRDNTLKLQPSTLLSERDISLNGKQGRELVINFNETYIKYRLFLIGRRMFQASIRVKISRKDDPIFQDRANKFLDSFQILENSLNNAGF